MEGAKKYAVAIGLVVVILICAIFIIKRGISPGTPEPPERVLQQKMDLIDKDTMEGVTLTMGEIRKLKQKDGYYQNPKSGNYTLALSTLCASCRQVIPAPVPPPSLRQDYLKRVPTVAEQTELRKWEAEQKCPKCGKRPF